MELYFWRFEDAMLGYDRSAEIDRHSLEVAVEDYQLLRRIRPDFGSSMHLFGEQFIFRREKLGAIGQHIEWPVINTRSLSDHCGADLIDNAIKRNSISATDHHIGA